MSERHMRQRVIRALRPAHAVSVENPCHPGTPDINFVEGWIELKQRERWPRRRSDIVTLPHPVTPQQRIWLRTRAEKGGNVYLLLQVDQDWLLFRGDVASEVVGLLNRDGLEAAALRTWRGGLNEIELLHAVSSGCEVKGCV